ncbi:hypothetical protein [Microbulbifer sp. GL-2]|uniref:hypothetical protein n=1 Tax=Microbulbifer sp. GL-2 TaxID=2591606 RepID=UPI00117D1176|nr:hypothetical protein [Microbulbifer sp. GL-2]
MKSVLAIVLFTLLTGSVYANSINKQLKACSEIMQDSDRLVCYDGLSNSLEQRAEQDFGQELKQVSEAPESIEAKIANIQKGAYDKKIITLDNGQIWKQNDSARTHWSSGDRVTVERALFGSFFMKLADGGRKMRVKRLK